MLMFEELKREKANGNSLQMEILKGVRGTTETTDNAMLFID